MAKNKAAWIVEATELGIDTTEMTKREIIAAVEFHAKEDVETVKAKDFNHIEVAAEIVAPSSDVQKCDTCGRMARVSKCKMCNKTYCNNCRKPNPGPYKTCLFCNAVH